MTLTTAPLSDVVFEAQAEAMYERGRGGLQEVVRQYWEAAGLLGYHTWDSRNSVKGFPDCVVVTPTGVIYAELKREKERPSPEQARWLDELSVAGEWCFLWRPRHWLSGAIAEILNGSTEALVAPNSGLWLPPDLRDQLERVNVQHDPYSTPPKKRTRS